MIDKPIATQLNSEIEFQKWACDVAEYLKSNHQNLTLFPAYYTTQTFNFIVLRQLLSEYFNFDKKMESVLEIGCGVGIHSLLLSRFTNKFFGIDIPGEYLGYTPEGFNSSAEVAHHLVSEIFGVTNASFADAFPDSIPVEDSSFDLIYTWTVLEHIPELEKSYKEMYRVLKPGGRMIHVVPNVMSAIDTLIRSNVEVSKTGSQPLGFVGAARYLLSDYFYLAKNGKRRREFIVPHCHSEFLSDYQDQLNLYISDSYIHPLIKMGLVLERLVSVRDFNYAIVVRKPLS